MIDHKAFVFVKWPDSQYYMEKEGVEFSTDHDGAVYVPRDVFDKVRSDQLTQGIQKAFEQVMNSGSDKKIAEAEEELAQFDLFVENEEGEEEIDFEAIEWMGHNDKERLKGVLEQIRDTKL